MTFINFLKKLELIVILYVYVHKYLIVCRIKTDLNSYPTHTFSTENIRGQKRTCRKLLTIIMSLKIYHSIRYLNFISFNTYLHLSEIQTACLLFWKILPRFLTRIEMAAIFDN